MYVKKAYPSNSSRMITSYSVNEYNNYVTICFYHLINDFVISCFDFSRQKQKKKNLKKKRKIKI